LECRTDLNKRHIELEIEEERKYLLKYMRRAFGFLPKISDPLILDIGCGSGVPTIELAKISNGNVIGIDIDQVAIDRFQCNIEREGLMNKIEVFNQSLFDITFPKGTFDIIWSEGSIFVIGFEKGINYWSEYLKPGGFLVVHDDFKNMKKKIGIVAKSGKSLVNCFPLPKNAWWNEYYEPLKKRIDCLCLLSPLISIKAGSSPNCIMK